MRHRVPIFPTFLKAIEWMPESLLAIFDALPYLLQGLMVTLVVVAGAMVLRFAIGAPPAVGQVHGHPVLRHDNR